MDSMMVIMSSKKNIIWYDSHYGIRKRNIYPFYIEELLIFAELKKK